MADIESIVAVGLLSQGDLDALGSAYSRAYPIDEVPCFNALLAAIDEADREFRCKRDARLSSSVRP